MTHTLHRSDRYQTLTADYVILAIASQTVHAGNKAMAFKQFADIVLKHDPLNFGDMRTGNRYRLDLEAIHAGYDNHSIVHAVFAKAETVATVLKELKEADLGLSIVVSGLFEKTGRCCRAAGLKQHTLQYALGVFGKTDLLPQPWILDLSTMCGHGMVSSSLIEDLAQQMRDRRITAEAASAELARQCYCGIFNPERAARILKRATRREQDRQSHDARGSYGHQHPHRTTR